MEEKTSFRRHGSTDDAPGHSMSWAEISAFLKDKEKEDLLQLGEGGLNCFWPGSDGFPAEVG